VYSNRGKYRQFRWILQKTFRRSQRRQKHDGMSKIAAAEVLPGTIRRVLDVEFMCASF
jgi:hypothetical protein